MANTLFGDLRGIQISPDSDHTTKYFIILMDLPAGLASPPVFSFQGFDPVTRTLVYNCDKEPLPPNVSVTTYLVDVFTQQGVNPANVKIVFNNGSGPDLLGQVNQVQLNIPTPTLDNVTSFVIQSATNTSCYFACGLASVSNPSINPVTGVPITLEFPGGGTNTYLEMTPVANASGSTTPIMCTPSTYMQFAGIIFPASNGSAFDYDNALVEGTSNPKAVNIVPVGDQVINYNVFFIDLMTSSAESFSFDSITEGPTLNYNYAGNFPTAGSSYNTFFVGMFTDEIMIGGVSTPVQFVAVKDASGKVKKGDLNKTKKIVTPGFSTEVPVSLDEETGLNICRPFVIQSVINKDNYFVGSLMKSEADVTNQATFEPVGVSANGQILGYVMSGPAQRSMPSATAVLAVRKSTLNEFGDVVGPDPAGMRSFKYGEAIHDYLLGDVVPTFID